MKRIFMLTIAIAFFCFPFSSQGSEQQTLPEKQALHTASHIKMIFKGGEVIVALFDTAISRDFMSLLPLNLSFEDYVQTEKIASLPRKLNISDSSDKGLTGDFSYYAPWGNLAVFYKGTGNGHSLYIMGRIISGKEKLAAMKNDFPARIELVSESK